MKLLIDGKPLEALSVDQLGATLQQIAAELNVRGNAMDYAVQQLHPYLSTTLLWAFDKVQYVGDTLRRAVR